MTPLLNSAGHLAALNKLIEITKFGPEAMFGWTLPESWDYFLAGRAAMTFTWGDLGALAQETPERGGKSTVQGKTGAAPIPGTNAYFNVASNAMVETEEPNMVGNTTGRIVGRRHLEVLQGAGSHIFPARADGDQTQVRCLRLSRLGRR